MPRPNTVVCWLNENVIAANAGWVSNCFPQAAIHLQYYLFGFGLFDCLILWFVLFVCLRTVGGFQIAFPGQRYICDITAATLLNLDLPANPKYAIHLDLFSYIYANVNYGNLLLSCLIQDGLEWTEFLNTLKGQFLYFSSSSAKPFTIRSSSSAQQQWLGWMLGSFSLAWF